MSEENILKGTVIYKDTKNSTFPNGIGVEGLKVLAYDIDRHVDPDKYKDNDFVGEANTEADGGFKFNYEEWFDKNKGHDEELDVYFNIFWDNKFIYRESVKWNRDPSYEYTISIPKIAKLKAMGLKINQCIAMPDILVIVYNQMIKGTDVDILNDLIQLDINQNPRSLQSLIDKSRSDNNPFMSRVRYDPNISATIFASGGLFKDDDIGSGYRIFISDFLSDEDGDQKSIILTSFLGVVSDAKGDDSERLLEIINYLKHNFDEKMDKIAGSVTNAGQTVAGSVTNAGQTVAGSITDAATTVKETVEAIPYPVLTEQVNISGSPRMASGVSGATSLGAVVDSALREVLAWKPKASDPKGFTAALAQAFTAKEVDGRTEYTWAPRSYAVQADMGAITGAQASLYARAKAALDQSLPLLEGLYALNPAADPENVEASRAVVRSELTELVNELGVEGGPRIERVNSLFGSLLGVPIPDKPGRPEDVNGDLGKLRDVFGLVINNVNTIPEEENLTNFLIIVDYVNSLEQSWKNNQGGVYLGTQLVLLSRSLAVVAESVQEVYFTMDSVFIGQAERQAIQLKFNDNTSIFVGELLSWVERFATEEGPRLIRDASKAGVEAFKPTVKRLFELVNNAKYPSGIIDLANTRLPAGYRTHRVQRAIEELAGKLSDIQELAKKL